MCRSETAAKFPFAIVSDDGVLRMRGLGLLLARLAWIMLIVPTYILLIVTIPSYFISLQQLHPLSDQVFTVQLTAADLPLLQSLGLSLDIYALIMLLSSLLLQICYAAVGIVLFWRRSDDRAALLTSFALMMLPFGFSDVTLHTLPPDWLWLIPVLGALGNASLLSCGYVFPDGQFVPRWTRWLLLALLVYWLVVATFPSWQIDQSWFSLTIFLGFAVSTLLAQLYRYRYVSTPRQRQQTRWAVFGVVIAVAGNIIPRLLYYLVLSPLSHGSPLAFALEINLIRYSMLGIPFTVGIAILSSHLWDIDVIINRTLVYVALTTTLVLVYIILVFVMQLLLHDIISQAWNSEVAIISSTLAIAALFQPLRHHLQQAIDRHFYRQKYNAARILATLSATLRDEVDLNQLSEQLRAAVEETVQPTHVSLWLRGFEQPKKSQPLLQPYSDNEEKRS
jgi:hypothetical protein